MSLFNTTPYNAGTYNGPTAPEGAYEHIIEAIHESFALPAAGLLATFPTGLMNEWSPTKAVYPNCTLESFFEEPGEVEGDVYYTVVFAIRHQRAKQCVMWGQVVRAWWNNADDTATPRPRLVWRDGYEAAHLEYPNDLTRERQRIPGGGWLWRYDLTYQFRGVAYG